MSGRLFTPGELRESIATGVQGTLEDLQEHFGSNATVEYAEGEQKKIVLFGVPVYETSTALGEPNSSHSALSLAAIRKAKQLSESGESIINLTREGQDIIATVAGSDGETRFEPLK